MFISFVLAVLSISFVSTVLTVEHNLIDRGVQCDAHCAIFQVRDAFALGKEKAPTIIFIDELDAIGTKRFDR
jgi:AAA+ superfamily predicted ATPase